MNPYLEEKAAEYRRRDVLGQSAVDRFCQDTGIDRRGPIHKLMCHALCGLGHLLVALGRRLEAMELPAYARPMPPPQPR